MNYDLLIANYPYIDLFLELFKGIAPTFVALLAILINNSRAKKRDMIKARNEIIIRVFNEVQTYAMDLANMIFSIGEDFIEYTENLYKDKSADKDPNDKGDNEYFIKLNKANAQMLLLARKALYYTDTQEHFSNNKELSFYECFHMIACFSDTYADLMAKFNKKLLQDKNGDRNKLFDWVQQEGYNESDKAEKAIIEYIKTISKARDNLLKLK